METSAGAHKVVLPLRIPLTSPIVFKYKRVYNKDKNITRKRYNQRLQTNPRHRDEETQNPVSHNKIKAEHSAFFRSKNITKPKRAPRNTPQNTGPTQHPYTMRTSINNDRITPYN